jgi:hypothetical protein
MKIIKWPESELDGLFKMDFAKDRGQYAMSFGTLRITRVLSSKNI